MTKPRWLKHVSAQLLRPNLHICITLHRITMRLWMQVGYLHHAL
jgi:hypothetical protein